MADLRSLVQQATQDGPWYEEGIYSGVRHLARNCDWYYDDLPPGMGLPGRDDARLIVLAPVIAQLVIDMADALEDLDPLEHSHAEIPALLARFAALGEETP